MDGGMGVSGDVLRPGSEAAVSGGSNARRGSSPPNAVTVFRGLRVLLEQNSGSQTGSAEVHIDSVILENLPVPDVS